MPRNDEPYAGRVDRYDDHKPHPTTSRLKGYNCPVEEIAATYLKDETDGVGIWVVGDRTIPRRALTSFRRFRVACAGFRVMTRGSTEEQHIRRRWYALRQFLSTCSFLKGQPQTCNPAAADQQERRSSHSALLRSVETIWPTTTLLRRNVSLTISSITMSVHRVLRTRSLLSIRRSSRKGSLKIRSRPGRTKAMLFTTALWAAEPPQRSHICWGASGSVRNSRPNTELP